MSKSVLRPIAAVATIAASVFLPPLAAFAITAALTVGSPVADLQPKPAPVLPSGSNLFGETRPRGNRQLGMTPIRRRGHWLRWTGFLCGGDCMVPLVHDGARAMVDRKAAIRPGDLVCFKLKSDPSIMFKRFVAVEDGEMEVETSNPDAAFTAPLSDIEWCYRIRAVAVDRAELRRKFIEAFCDEEAHQQRLGLASSGAA